MSVSKSFSKNNKVDIENNFGDTTPSNEYEEANEIVEYENIIKNNEDEKVEGEEEKPKQIEFKTNFSYGFDDNDEIQTDDLKHLEPKLRDAWIEMRRLDKVLKRVMDKEKRIKLETKSLIEKNRVELELLKMTSDRKESKTEQENTENYIALQYTDTQAGK